MIVSTIKNISLLIMLFILSSSLYAGSERQEDLSWLYDEGYHNFSYLGWLYGNETYKLKVSIDKPTEGWLIYGGDVIEKITYCEPSSGFYCFFSRSLAFAVPKNTLSAKEWVVQGTKFKVSEEKLDITIFGARFDNLYVIESPANATLVGKHTNKPTYWLYSQKYGVIGFGLNSIPDNRSIVYWLKGTAGFAANNETSDR